MGRDPINTSSVTTISAHAQAKYDAWKLDALETLDCVLDCILDALRHWIVH